MSTASQTFKITVDDKEIELAVKKPSKDDLNKARKVYNETFSEALISKAPLRRVVSNLLKEQGLWDEEKTKQLDELNKEINEMEFTLEKGGIPLSKAREIAIEMRRKRLEISSLLSVHSELDSSTAEGQADDARFNYLVSACVVYNDSKEPYFKDYETYLVESDSDAANQGARILANLMYELDQDYTAKLPENQFLKDHGFVDSELRLINKDGHLISSDGRLIDEEGRYVDEQGNRIDKFGHALTEDGKFLVDKKPFLDDDGNPIIETKKVEEPKVEESKEETILEQV
jgi:hypothetical protein